MNCQVHEEYQYLNILRQIIENGTTKPNRTGIKTKSIFGNMMKFKLNDGNKKILPLLTTKNMEKSAEIIFNELEFFIKGQTDNKILQEKGIKIWNANTSREYLDSVGLNHYEEGDLGCFVAGTKVLTDTGYKNIEDVNMNDKLYTHKGNWQPINNIQERYYTGELYKIKTKHHPFEIIATSEHPFLTKFKNDIYTPDTWVCAKNLKKDNCLLGLKIKTDEIMPDFITEDCQWFDAGAASKDTGVIPKWVQDAPTKYVYYFVYGYLWAMCCNPGKISLNMSYELQRLFLKLGDTFIISCIEDDSFDLSIDFNCQIDNGIVWFPISSIEVETVQNIKVYNFETANDHSYTVGNINCHNSEYGWQWRHFGAEYKGCKEDYTGKGFDQLEYVVNEIKNNPYSRRLLITAWNPLQLKDMCLPPCHVMFQFNVEPKPGTEDPYYLSCMLYQRSADLPLGVPFNIASYAALTHIIADLTNLTAKELIYTTADTHVYENQIPLAYKQVNRIPYPFPNLEFDYGNDPKPTKIDNYKASYLKVVNYKHWPNILYPFSV